MGWQKRVKIYVCKEKMVFLDFTLSKRNVGTVRLKFVDFFLAYVAKWDEVGDRCHINRCETSSVFRPIFPLIRSRQINTE